jgi:hypothetical protein
MSERIQRLLRDQERIKKEIEDTKKTFKKRKYYPREYKWDIACKIVGYRYVHKESLAYNEVMEVFKQL